MRGYFAGGGGDSTSGSFGEGITFPRKLPRDFNPGHVRYLGKNPMTSRCPGPGRAKRGWMCFYEQSNVNATWCCVYDQNHNDPQIAAYGTRIYWTITGPGSLADGQWVVRAP